MSGSRLRRIASAAVVGACAAVLVCACGPGTGGPSTAATRTPGHGTPSPAASPTPQLVGTTRTVLSPLGLFMHSEPTLVSTNHIGNLQQGATVTVLDYRPDSGGWFKVMGQSTSGCIVADPTLTAMGSFTPYDATSFSVLVPENWTFAQESTDVVFRPQSGTLSIVVRSAATLSALGAAGLPGYTNTFTQEEVVCGYTGNLLEYASGGAPAATPSPAGSSATHLAMYADIRLKFDTTHAMLIGFNYDNASQIGDFENFYNSISFPFPLCQATATPAPT
ncbi:MAG: SH3 domain-containing protein [Chloroflexi bacterium]|nr:MAG: SH3 domain-containing protein [Chloroflexota bacterium]